MSNTPESGRHNAFILSGMQALGGANPALVVALSSLVGQQLASSPGLATLPVTTFNLGLALGILPAAFVMQRLGRQKGYFLGTLFGIGGGLLATLGIYLGSFLVFCLGVALAGCYASYVQSYRFAAADGASDEFRPKATSWVMAGGLLGAVIASQTILWTSDLTPLYPFSASFLSQAILAACVIPFIFFLRPQGMEASSRHKGPYRGRPLGQIARQPRFIVAVLSGVASYGLMNFMMTASPLAMIGCGHTISDSTLGIQWHILAMFGPSFITGDLIKRFGKIPVTMLGLLFLAAASTVALMGLTVNHFWVSLILLGIGWNFSFIGATTMVIDCYRPEERSRVQALNDLIVFGCVAISSFSSGQVLAVYGWDGINKGSFPIVLLLILALSWLWLKERPNSRAQA